MFFSFYHLNKSGVLKTVKIENKYVPSKNKLYREMAFNFIYAKVLE